MANIKTQSGEASSLVGMLNNDFNFVLIFSRFKRLVIEIKERAAISQLLYINITQRIDSVIRAYTI